MSGLAEKLFTAQQVRHLDDRAINELGIPGYELMCRAGAALFKAAQERYPEARNWLVMCGAGNNGGDGYVVARLAMQAGLRATVLALKSPSGLSGDALQAAGDWQAAGGVVQDWPGDGNERPDLVIDALLGTGLDRTVEGRYQAAIERINALSCPRVAVDIPSGLNADTGAVMGCAVRAGLTVSFIGIKRGLVTLDGPDHTGLLVFDDLAVPASVADAAPDCGTLIHEKILMSLATARLQNSHKGHYGHVGVIGGNAGMAGAVRLAGEAALRCGAGLVSVATHPAHAHVVNVSRPELMVSAIREEGLRDLLAKASVIAAGPGLGSDDWARRQWSDCINSDLPLVLDADGLNLLAEQPRERSDWILTPHPAEAARLLGVDTDKLQSDRVAHALRIAERYAAVVVLKGCGTVVAHPDGRYAICPLGNPGMATAGSGDVLTGVIAALLGQGYDTWQAAQLGVVVHAAAGDRARDALGERGMLAGDIIDAIPAVLR